jgi:hypothetical protein
MGRPRKAPTTQARIAEFAHEELEVLVDTLQTEAHFETSAVTMLGALVLAARRLPLEIVKALVPAYLEREQAVLAAAEHVDGEET